MSDSPITARYDGKCAACGLPIIAGTEIKPAEWVESWWSSHQDPNGYESSQGEKVTRTWTHAVCPEPRPAVICTTCFLEKPCPCEDGQ